VASLAHMLQGIPGMTWLPPVLAALTVAPLLGLVGCHSSLSPSDMYHVPTEASRRPLETQRITA
jgi:hypothetical protein